MSNLPSAGQERVPPSAFDVQPGAPVTVRLHRTEGWVSNDDGTTRHLSSAQVDALRVALANVLHHNADGTRRDAEQAIRDTATAVVHATLGEAAAVRPVPDQRLGPDSTEVDVPATGTPVPLTRHAPGTAATRTPAASALATRRSIRDLGPTTFDAISSVLDLAFRLHSVEPADDGGTKRWRAIPSAGARQPLIPLLLSLSVQGLPEGLWRLDADASELYLLEPDLTTGPLHRLRDGLVAAGQMSTDPAAVVVLVARFDATLARYPAGSTLVWRDAGAAIATIALAAHIHGLGACPLGTSGLVDAKLIARAGISGHLIADVGAVALGSPQPAP